MVNDEKKSKIHVSIMIAQYYKRFQLRNMHQTYSLTKDYQRRLVLVPLRNHYRCFVNTFYDIKNMHLNKLDDVANGVIDEIHYTEEDLKLLDEFNPILEIDPKF